MFENGKISSLQFFILVFLFTIGNTIINAPSLVVSVAKQDAWLSYLISLGFALGLVLIYCTISKRLPNKNLIQFNEILLGKVLGTFFSLLFLVYFYILASLMMRQFIDFMTTIIMPETPGVAIKILYLSCIVVGATLGIETLGRTGEIILPTLVFVIIFFLIFLIPEMDFRNLEPFFENGISPLMEGTLVSIGIPFLQLVVILMIIPFAKNQEKTKMLFLLGVFLGGGVVVLIILYSILTLGVTLTEIKLYPTYFMAQKISIANIIERLEVFIAGLWFITIFFKTTLLLYATNLGIAQLFKIENSKPILFALSYILLILTQLISPSIVYFNDFFKNIIPPYGLTMGLVLPLILLVVSYIRKDALALR